MCIGEVCRNTNDVIRLANFYKALLEIDNGSGDPVHQKLLAMKAEIIEKKHFAPLGCRQHEFH